MQSNIIYSDRKSIVTESRSVVGWGMEWAKSREEQQKGSSYNGAQRNAGYCSPNIRVGSLLAHGDDFVSFHFKHVQFVMSIVAP